MTILSIFIEFPKETNNVDNEWWTCALTYRTSSTEIFQKIIF